MSSEKEGDKLSFTRYLLCMDSVLSALFYLFVILLILIFIIFKINI